MSALDAKIDELYRLAPGEFTAARNALAKSLTGDAAKRVKALAKPTVVPWAVNQVYWQARATFDRLMKSGEKLRTAQIATLEGRNADVRAASESHRRAINDAVGEAERIAAEAGLKPPADALARTFESLSLATAPPETPGRFTEALQPAGFEALLGVTPSDVRTTKVAGRSGKLELRKGNIEPRPKTDERLTKAAAVAAKREAARQAAERKQYEAAVKQAEANLARVEAAERTARDAWERAHDDLLAARQALTDLRRTRFTPA